MASGTRGRGLKRVALCAIMERHSSDSLAVIPRLIHIEPYFPAGMDREGKIKPLDWGNVIENIR